LGWGRSQFDGMCRKWLSVPFFLANLTLSTHFGILKAHTRRKCLNLFGHKMARAELGWVGIILASPNFFLLDHDILELLYPLVVVLL
jgi:hypothetical protein